MYSFNSQSSLALLAQTAKTHAIGGASAGLAFGAVQSVIAVHHNRLRNGYDILAEGLTHVGTGAILGVLGAMAASVAGVSVTAITSRRILTVAVPMVASAMVTSGAHQGVYRLVHPWSERAVNGLKRTLRTVQKQVEDFP